MTRAIIIAAGEASRWRNYLGIPKHFAPIDGEPIIHRTVRLLRERNITEIYVVGPTDDSRYIIEGTTLFTPIKEPYNQDADKFLNSRDLWNTAGRTVVFYGDVFFTEYAMDSIVNFEGKDWTLFCRFDASKITGTRWGECFAQSFYPKDIEKHKEKLYYIADLKRRNIIKRCGGWEHYRAMQECQEDEVRNHKNRNGKYFEINDWTDDFDYAEDYDRFIKRWNNRKTT
jgi:hypothetical protein